MPVVIVAYFTERRDSSKLESASRAYSVTDLEGVNTALKERAGCERVSFFDKSGKYVSAYEVMYLTLSLNKQRLN